MTFRQLEASITQASERFSEQFDDETEFAKRSSKSESEQQAAVLSLNYNEDEAHSSLEEHILIALITLFAFINW